MLRATSITCGSALARDQRRSFARKRAPTLAFLCLLVLAGTAGAKRVYKYQDENGIWHFTDKKPDTTQEVQSRLVDVEPERMLKVREEGSPKEPEYVFYNGYHGPMQVAVEAADAKNLQSEPPLPGTFVLPARTERQLFELGPADPRRGWSFRLSFTYVPGSPQARHDNPLYRLPFPAGESFPVSQAFEGGHTHTDEASRFAVDIVMPEGTPVLAARDGVVMNVERDFYRSGTDKERYGPRANHVRVLHDDGTMAVYAHLKLESVQVHPGETVLAGDLLAYSGNTGYSTGPHLHFAIQRNAGMRIVSEPFRFAGSDGRPIRPEAGTTLGGR